MGKLSSVLAYAILLSGCVLSIDAVVPGDEATFDHRLIGNWEEVSSSDRAVISAAGANAYAI